MTLMEYETDVLIVGAGPTGLMMASQLARFGIPFRIMDKQADRSRESRAFGIQAKSMEIFQNLGIASEIIKRAQKARKIGFHVNGELKFKLNFEDIDVKDTPYPHLFLLPQSDTEQILLEHLEKQNIFVERTMQLISFDVLENGIEANIINNKTGTAEKIHCRYIIGCDGAHSTVRRILNIPFEGAAYNQEFILADVVLQGKIEKDSLTFFMSKDGVCAFIPLHQDFCRLMLASMNNYFQPEDRTPTLEEIEKFVKIITHKDIQLSDPVWISRFHLHHRAVKYYQKGNAFLAGDAAHIHSPVGGQGMNTGLQDATNLAWKLAFVLKYKASTALLDTYQTERHRVGQVLVNTTDKIFGFITSKQFFITQLRLYIIPFFMHFLAKSKKFIRRIFCFASELGIHYHENACVSEKTQGADPKFLAGPKAGCRAPDAPVGNSTLFELFKMKPCNILIFESTTQSNSEYASKILDIEKLAPEIIAVHRFAKSSHTQTLFDRYGVNNSALYFIRPDGYIGFRSFGYEFDPLMKFINSILI